MSPQPPGGHHQAVGAGRCAAPISLQVRTCHPVWECGQQAAPYFNRLPKCTEEQTSVRQKHQFKAVRAPSYFKAVAWAPRENWEVKCRSEGSNCEGLSPGRVRRPGVGATGRGERRREFTRPLSPVHATSALGAKTRRVRGHSPVKA